MYVKECEFCGKRFVSKSANKKFCSNECKREMAKQRKMEEDQPCWLCKNACGGCLWSSDFLPIEGWDAEVTIIKGLRGYISSYKINSCPNFIRG